MQAPASQHFSELSSVSRHQDKGGLPLPRMTGRPQAAESDQAFRQLFDAHLAFVWRTLRRHGVREADLPDACQDVFLVVHRRLAEFEGRSRLATWIYSISVHVARGTRRKAHVSREVYGAVNEAAQPLEPTQFAHALRGQALRELNAALAQLPPDQSEVFVLYELEGLRMAEVAAALEVPESTALYRLYAAREAVQAFMRRRERHAVVSVLPDRNRKSQSR